MSLKPVLEKLNTLQETNSTNEKVELLKAYLPDKLFNLVVRIALQPTLKYKIKKLPTPQPVSGKNELKDLFGLLQLIAGQSGVSKADKEAVSNMAASFDKETWEVVQRIVKKDLRCGTTATLINRAATTRLIKVMPYMRYKSDKHLKKMLFPLMAQLKCDGTFVNLLVKAGGKLQFLTRNASPVFQLTHLKEEIKHIKKFTGYVFHCELLVWNEDYTKFLDRKTGNGIISKCIKKTCPTELLERIAIRVWDVVPEYDFWNGRCDAPYRDRFDDLHTYVKVVGNSRYMSIVESRYVYTMEQADKFYKDMRRQGEEGAVLKNDHGPWHHNTGGSKYGCKMKSIKEAELVVTGWSFGDSTKKYRTVLGTVHCETADGLLKVNVSGFTDKERGVLCVKNKPQYEIIDGEKIAVPNQTQLDRWDDYCARGKILEVEYESVIQDKDTKEYSLFLPRSVSFRQDKDEADTLQHLLNKE